MTVQVQKRECAGAVYYELMRVLNTREVSSAIISDTQKYVYPHSYFSVDLVSKSWKYGSELQFKSFSYRMPTLEPRNDFQGKGVYRLEAGYLPVDRNTVRWLHFLADCVEQFLQSGKVM